MALDETRDVPMLSRAVVVLQDEDVATRGGAGIALAATLMVGMRQSRTDGITQCRGITVDAAAAI